MQTFLPLVGFTESARVLDRQRLGKQRIEVLQVLRVLRGETRGWTSHPAVKMWRGAEGALAIYGLAICDEWIARGYMDGCLEKIARLGAGAIAPRPPWLGNSRLHSSHRAALLWKNPGWYKHYGWQELPKLDYWWPTEGAEG